MFGVRGELAEGLEDTLEDLSECYQVCMRMDINMALKSQVIVATTTILFLLIY